MSLQFPVLNQSADCFFKKTKQNKTQNYTPWNILQLDMTISLNHYF